MALKGLEEDRHHASCDKDTAYSSVCMLCYGGVCTALHVPIATLRSGHCEASAVDLAIEPGVCQVSERCRSQVKVMPLLSGLRGAPCSDGRSLMSSSLQPASICRSLQAVQRGSQTLRGRRPTQITPRITIASADAFAYDTVTTVFTAFNTLLLVPWCMMVFVPNLDFTRSVIKSNVFLYIFCAMFLYLFAAATVEAVRAGANLSDEVQFLFLEAVADPKKMAAMFSADRPTYAAQDWAHLCTWDYFVGYWIYLQGQDKKVFTRHSLVLAFNSGPPGLISHFITEAITNAIRSNAKTAPAAVAPPQEASTAQPSQNAGKKPQD